MNGSYLIKNLKLSFSVVSIVFYFLTTNAFANSSVFIQPKGTICAGWKFLIEPDMQINDADLTAQSVKKSFKWLSENFENEGYLIRYGIENSMKKIKGYLLKKDYLNAQESDKDIARSRYCTWLKSEGFWYD